MSVGHLENECYDRKCCKQMFVLLCYSTGANLFRFTKGIAICLETSPLVEKGLLHELVRYVGRSWTVGKVSSERLFQAVEVRVGSGNKYCVSLWL